MTITTFSSRQFNQDTSRAKKAASQGPVFITDRGEPAHVLLTIEDYRRLSSNLPKIADLLTMPSSLIDRLGLPEGVEDIELEIPPRTEYPRDVDFEFD
jgi:prevent-host-death family protein